MKSIRAIASVLIFALAASGSIWIGWIYAGTNKKDATTKLSALGQHAEDTSNSVGGASSSQLPAKGSSSSGQALIPNLSKIEILPGAGISSSGTDQLNGYPTVTRDFLRQTPGSDQSNADSLPDLNFLLPGSSSSSSTGTTSSQGLTSGRLGGSGASRP